MPNDLPVLGQIFPELTDSGSDFAIATSVLAYATGDAFGVAYEFEALVKPPIAKAMLGKPGWPIGGVSDDTLLSLMTISCLDASSAEEAAASFKSRLLEAKGRLRGLGPTTRHALGIFVEDREVEIIGVTNGGMMRTALVALGFSGIQNPARAEWISSLCAATHFKTEALFAALLMAEIFASASGDVEWDIDSAIELALDNISEVPREISEALRHSKTFELPKNGVSLHPVETLLAIIFIVRKSETVWEAYENAICAGGDTDTLAALSGALVALQNPNSFYELPFINEVNWQEIPDAKFAIETLLNNRGEK